MNASLEILRDVGMTSESINPDSEGAILIQQKKLGLTCDFIGCES